MKREHDEVLRWFYMPKPCQTKDEVIWRKFVWRMSDYKYLLSICSGNILLFFI